MVLLSDLFGKPYKIYKISPCLEKYQDTFLAMMKFLLKFIILSMKISNKTHQTDPEKT